MAFGQKIEAKDLIGMEPEQLAEKLAKIDSYDARFTAIQEAQTAATNSILERFEALKPKEPVREQGDPDVSFLANPSDTLNERLKPLSQQTYENTIGLVHRDARDLFPKDFERWGTEIVKKMGELSLQQQADPRVWRACVMMVRGEHASDLEKDGATGKYSYLEPVSAGLRPDPKTSDGLSVAEREMVRTLKPFGMTPDKYNKGKERLTQSRAARLGRFSEVAS
jgi:hypothetical protein